MPALVPASVTASVAPVAPRADRSHRTLSSRGWVAPRSSPHARFGGIGTTTTRGNKNESSSRRRRRRASRLTCNAGGMMILVDQLKYAAAGGIGACISHSGAVPLDVVKTRVQLNPKKYSGTFF
jgi:hypothetical protein